MLRSALQPSKLVAETLAMSAATLALDRASHDKPAIMACVVRGAWCVVRGAQAYPPQVQNGTPYRSLTDTPPQVHPAEDESFAADVLVRGFGTAA